MKFASSCGAITHLLNPLSNPFRGVILGIEDIKDVKYPSSSRVSARVGKEILSFLLG